MPLERYEQEVHSSVRLIRRNGLRQSAQDFADHILGLFRDFDKLICSHKSNIEIAHEMSSTDSILSKKITQLVASMAFSSVMTYSPNRISNHANRVDLLACTLVRELTMSEYAKRFTPEIARECSSIIISDSLPKIIPQPLRKAWGNFWVSIMPSGVN
jgi:hypothetical protein